ncbi:MAG: hypothetical protein RSG92_24445 [Pseudomonas sp.]
MNIDKSKLQSLLWAVVGAWKAGDQDMHLRTDALDEFLGESTVEEVALGLLDEIQHLAQARDDARELRSKLGDRYDAALAERDQLKAESEKTRSFLAEVSRTSGDQWAVMAARNLLKEFGHD